MYIHVKLCFKLGVSLNVTILLVNRCSIIVQVIIYIKVRKRRIFRC